MSKKRNYAEMQRDHELIRGFQAGDERALTALFNAHSIRLYSLAHDMLGNREDANDALQNTFMGIHKGINDFNFDYEFRSWSYKILKNICVNMIESKKRECTKLERALDSNSLPLPSQVPSPLQIFETKELGKQIQHTLGKLSQKNSQILKLRFNDEISYEEMASKLGITIGTVMSRLSYARKYFGNNLKKIEQEEENEGI